MQLHDNSWWYLGLAFVSVITLATMFFHLRDWNVFVLYLIMVGYGYLIEFIIYILLGSYQYYPKIMPKQPYFDSNLGAIASNFLSLPVSAVMIAMYRLGWGTIALCVLLFAGIEWLFVELGIYRHNWWHIGYTSLGLPTYYLIAKCWSRWLKNPLKGFRKAVLLFFIIGTITSNFQVLGFMILQTRSYHVGWFADPAHDTTAFAAVYYLSVSLFFTLVLMLRNTYPKIKFILAMAFVLSVSLTLKHIGIIKVHVWWDLPFMLVACSLALWLSGLAAARLSRERHAWR